MVMRIALWVALVVIGWWSSGPAQALEINSGSAPRLLVVVADGGQDHMDKVLHTYEGKATLIIDRRHPAEERWPAQTWQAVAEESEEIYFFEGPEELIEGQGRLWEALVPDIFQDGGSREIRQWAAEAMHYRARAHLDVGDREGAVEVMTMLVTAWDEGKPDDERHPPSVVELWNEVSSEAREDGGREDGGREERGRRTRPTMELEGAIEGEGLWSLFERWAKRYEVEAMVIVGKGDCGNWESGEVGVCVGKVSPTLMSWRPIDGHKPD